MDKIFKLLQQIYKYVYNQPAEDPNGKPITQIIAYESTTNINLPANTLKPVSVYIWGNNRAQVNYGNEILGADILVPQVPDFLKNFLLEKIKSEIITYETSKQEEGITPKEEAILTATTLNIIKKYGFLLTTEETLKIRKIFASRIRIPHQFKPLSKTKPLKETKSLNPFKRIKPWRSIPRPRS